MRERGIERPGVVGWEIDPAKRHEGAAARRARRRRRRVQSRRRGCERDERRERRREERRREMTTRTTTTRRRAVESRRRRRREGRRRRRRHRCVRSSGRRHQSRLSRRIARWCARDARGTVRKDGRSRTRGSGAARDVGVVVCGTTRARTGPAASRNGGTPSWVVTRRTSRVVIGEREGVEREDEQTIH